MSATTTESPPGAEKEEAATVCDYCAAPKHYNKTNYSHYTLLTGGLQAGRSDLPQLTGQLVSAHQLVQMAAIGQNAVVNGLLAAIRCSYYLLDKIMGPRVPQLTSSNYLSSNSLISREDEKKEGRWRFPHVWAWKWTPLFRIRFYEAL
jgi:hypothetical protein